MVLSLKGFANLGMKETFRRNTMILKTIGNEQVHMVRIKILDNIPHDKKGSIHGHHRSLDRPSQRKKTFNSKKVTPVSKKLTTEHFAEEADEAQHMHKLERKHQRRVEKERLEELLPRSDAGTRERKMEKRAETNAANRAFREKSPEVTISDATLMGGDDIKADLLNQKRIEAAREARREEIQRSKEAERLKRRSDLEKREDGTMEMLKRLAEERWGKQ
jgi:hypothetical protein